MHRVLLWSSPVLFLVVCCASNPKGRIMGDEEEGYVGAREAGASTFDRLIEGTVSRLLQRFQSEHPGDGARRVAFLGLENKTSEPLGAFHEQIYQLVDTSVNNSRVFRSISSRYVEAALREGRLRRDDLFIPAHQRTFAEVLEKLDQPVQSIHFGTLTSGTTHGDGVRQVDYMLTLELVDIASGDSQKDSVRLRKAYVR